jgi:hypothetical protein
MKGVAGGHPSKQVGGRENNYLKRGTEEEERPSKSQPHKNSYGTHHMMNVKRLKR